MRGGAPATRELALLEPGRTVARVDAVVLAGGSAFGLAAADGVMRFLAERGQGFPTAGGPVPIVPAACVFDLVEAARSRPGPDDGLRGRAGRRRDRPREGRVGAGTGATVGKWRGREHAVAGGFGVAAARCRRCTVVAFAVVNAVGDVIGADGAVLAGSTAPAGDAGVPGGRAVRGGPREHDARRGRDRRRSRQGRRATCSRRARTTASRGRCAPRTRASTVISRSRSHDRRRWRAHLDRLRVAAADVVADAIRTALR